MLDKINNNRISNGKQWAYSLPEHSLETFADSLAKVIKASGITQKELSRALRITNTTIGNYCNGDRRKPKPEFMIDIADYFDIKPSYFLEYRMYQLCKRIENNPELVDVFLDLASQPIRVCSQWKKLQKEQEPKYFNQEQGNNN